MRLPHDRLRVRVLGQWAGATGLAFTAAVTLDGVPVATIHDHADGTGIHLDADGSGWAGMAEYLAGCRLYGAPVDQRRLLVALVDEHYLSGATAQAHAEGATGAGRPTKGDQGGRAPRTHSRHPRHHGPPVMPTARTPAPTPPSPASSAAWRFSLARFLL